MLKFTVYYIINAGHPEIHAKAKGRGEEATIYLHFCPSSLLTVKLKNAPKFKKYEASSLPL